LGFTHTHTHTKKKVFVECKEITHMHMKATMITTRKAWWNGTWNTLSKSCDSQDYATELRGQISPYINTKLILATTYPHVN